MRLPQSETEYLNALVDAADLGAQKALIEADVIKPFLSLREAHRKYGQAVVNRWIKEGLIRPGKDGENNAKIRIDRLAIDAVSKASNRTTYLSTAERKTI
jgi:hypothetical protein